MKNIKRKLVLIFIPFMLVIAFLVLEYNGRFQWEQYQFFYPEEGIPKKYCLTAYMKTYQKGSTFDAHTKELTLTLVDPGISDTIIDELIILEDMQGIEYEIEWIYSDSLSEIPSKLKVHILEVSASAEIEYEYHYNKRQGSFKKRKLTKGISIRKSVIYNLK